MNKFEQLIKSKAKEYDVSAVMEDLGANNGGAMGSGQMDAEMPAPEMQQTAQPTPEEGAQTQEPIYDKPYQDLASLLYSALRTNFDDLEQSQQRKILAVHPEDVKDDKQGVALFKAWESVYNETSGIKEDENIEGDNPTFGPAAS